MKPHSARYPHYPSSLVICRAALARGPLVKVGPALWAFGRRRFNHWTITRLIDNGEAVQLGDHVVAWRPHA